jgi:ribulose-5-phosphate 4-epimerase/fuculose-1-phosphate aldolase
MVLGASVAEAFDDLFFLERACKVQAIAAASGARLKEVDRETARHTAGQMSGLRKSSADLHFAALRRMMQPLEKA